MAKIVSSIVLAIGLFCCSRIEKQPVSVSSDSIKIVKEDLVQATKIIVDDYAASIVYSSSDSDSLLLDNLDLKNLISLFKTSGRLIKEKEHSGGDCGGKFKRLVYNGDTLTIDKYSCGDYGFGNSQYLTHGDSLKLVRKYKMEWSAEPEFTVSEKIYEFSKGKVTRSERMKLINGWGNFDFANIPFVITTSSGQNDQMELKKEQRDLLSLEVLE